MSVPDEFAAFIRGLQPRIKAQVGALVEEDLAAAMRLAARVELWTTAETSGGGSGGSDQRQKGNRGRGQRQGAQSGGQGPRNQGKVIVVESTVSAVQGGNKKGQGQPQQQQQQGQQGRGRGRGQGGRPPCFLCRSTDHMVHDCPDWQRAREALKKVKKQGN